MRACSRCCCSTRAPRPLRFSTAREPLLCRRRARMLPYPRAWTTPRATAHSGLLASARVSHLLRSHASCTPPARAVLCTRCASHKHKPPRRATPRLGPPACALRPRVREPSCPPWATVSPRVAARAQPRQRFASAKPPPLRASSRVPARPDARCSGPLACAARGPRARPAPLLPEPHAWPSACCRHSPRAATAPTPSARAAWGCSPAARPALAASRRPPAPGRPSRALARAPAPSHAAGRAAPRVGLLDRSGACTGETGRGKSREKERAREREEEPVW
jgi:hypothetical protein